MLETEATTKVERVMNDENLPQMADCPDAPDAGHLAQYEELGYVAFEKVLTAAEVEAARAGCALAGIAAE